MDAEAVEAAKECVARWLIDTRGLVSKEIQDSLIGYVAEYLAAHTEAAIKEREEHHTEMVRHLATTLEKRNEDITDLRARLAAAEDRERNWKTPRPGEPAWTHGIRVVDGKAIDVLEGVIGKVEYDALKAERDVSLGEAHRVKAEIETWKKNLEELTEHIEYLTRRRIGVK